MIVFRSADGRTLTMADLRGLSGTFQYEIVGKSNAPAEADSLHKEARLAGGLGDFRRAITLLGQASNLAPQWPYPIYDMAFTYLLIEDYENARKYYRKTVELAPRGFFPPFLLWTLSFARRRVICRAGPTGHTYPWNG